MDKERERKKKKKKKNKKKKKDGVYLWEQDEKFIFIKQEKNTFEMKKSTMNPWTPFQVQLFQVN